MAVSTPEKEMLQRFAQYVFRREAAEIREDLHESVVEMVLYLKGRSLDRKTIKNEINTQLGLDFNQFIVDSVVGELISKGYVKQKNETFYLARHRRTIIDKTIKNRQSQINEIESKFISKFHSNLSKSTSNQDNEALKYLYAFLSSLFLGEGDLLLGIIRCSKEDIEFTSNYEPPKRLLRNLLIKVADKELKKAIKDSIASVFGKNETIQLLSAVGRNYLYFQLLNLDPECRLFQKESFSGKVLLLDTNFIMTLLLISRPGHQAAVKCVFFSKDLGVQFGFTERTKQEFLDQLKQSHHRLRKLQVTRIDTLASLDDDFIASYAMEKQKKPILKWKYFFYRYRTFVTILSKWDIREYEQALPPFEVYEEGLEDPVTLQVYQCWQGLTGRIKDENVAEHDSYHLLLIRKLREAKPSDTLGPRFWFLTFDSSLLCVDKGINKIIGRKNDLPSSIECWTWMDLIAPYLAPKISNEAQVMILSDLMKTQLSLLPAKIDTKKLVAVQTPKVNFDLFSPDQVKAILSDQFVQEHWKKFSSARAIHSPTARKHLEQLQSKVEDIAKEILMKKTQTELIARYVAIAMSIVTLILAAYGIIIKDYTVMSLFAFLTIVFMAIAVGYSTIEVNLKKFYARITKA